jgi:hypothetical protein
MNRIATGLASDEDKFQFRAAVSTDPAAASTARSAEVALRSSGRREEAERLRQEMDLAAGRAAPTGMPRVQSAPAIQSMGSTEDNPGPTIERAQSLAPQPAQSMPAPATQSLQRARDQITPWAKTQGASTVRVPGTAVRVPGSTVSRTSGSSIAVPGFPSVAERSHEGSPTSESPPGITPQVSPARRSGDRPAARTQRGSLLRRKFLPRRWGVAASADQRAQPILEASSDDELRAEEGRAIPPRAAADARAQRVFARAPATGTAALSLNKIEMTGAALRPQQPARGGSSIPTAPIATQLPQARGTPTPGAASSGSRSAAAATGAGPMRQIETPGGPRAVSLELPRLQGGQATRPRSPRTSKKSRGDADAAASRFRASGSADAAWLTPARSETGRQGSGRARDERGKQGGATKGQTGPSGPGDLRDRFGMRNEDNV